MDTETPPDSLPGFDLDDALKRLRGRWTMLRRLILSFAERVSTMESQFNNHLAKGEYDEAKLIAHTFKGTAANIGATELSTTSANLEQQLKDDQTTFNDADLKSFKNAVQQFLQSAKSLEDTPSEEDTPIVAASNPAAIGAQAKKIADNLFCDLGRAQEDMTTLENMAKNTDLAATASEAQALFANFKLKELKHLLEQRFPTT